MQRLTGHQASLCVGTQSGPSFICRNRPSICHNIPFIRPFICHNRPLNSKWSQFGFTLIELIVTVSVAAILVTVAAPSMVNMVKGNRMSTSINDFISDAMVARSAAVKRNLRVVICKSLDPFAANPICDLIATNLWTNGWIVFVDNDNSGQRNGAEVVLRQHGRAGTDITLTPSPALQTPLSYRPSGRPLGFLGGEITLCDSRGVVYAKAVVISTAGRPFSSKKKSDGTTLTCP